MWQMKKKLTLTVGVFIAALLLLTGCNSEQLSQEPEPISHDGNYISVEEALANAEETYRNIYGQTRSTQKKLSTVEFYGGTTRSNQDSEEYGYYIVNYDDGGFAILSADRRRLSTYAISDEGSLHLSDTIENKGLSWYINKVLRYEESGSYLPIGGGGGNIPPLDSLPGQGPNKTEYEYFEVCKPLLTGILKSMQQGSPFNNRCPVIGEIRSVTGCVPLAVGTVMAFFKWPKSIDGYNFDWNAMLTNKNHGGWAQLFYLLGKREYLNAEYKVSPLVATSVNPALIAPTMNKLGYKGAQYENFTTSKVSQDLSKGNPVLVGGQSSEGGHRWVIDGAHGAIITQPTFGNQTETRTVYYLHCVWGWGNTARGYYAFDSTGSAYLGGSPSTPDSGTSGSTPYFTDLTIAYNYSPNK